MKINEYLINFYNHYDEESRLRVKHGMVEFLTAMHYIEKYAGKKKYIHCGHAGNVKACPVVIYNQQDSTKSREENTKNYLKQQETLREYAAQEKGPCNLRKIPGVGKNIEQDLLEIGIRSMEDLKGKDPEELYQMDCIRKGFQEDRCQLYVFRCAVYFADHEEHESEKLKWWYWKDKKYPEKR